MWASSCTAIIFRNSAGTSLNSAATRISRLLLSLLPCTREIRVAALFKEVPAEFLKMIAVHELAHIKEKAHDKAFYQLCNHMEPHYHQYEFDLRVYLTHI